MEGSDIAQHVIIPLISNGVGWEGGY